VTDNWLYKQTGYRSGDPENRYIVNIRTESLEYATHIPVLKGKTKLDAQETEAHIPDLPKGELWLTPVDHIHCLYTVSFITQTYNLLKISRKSGSAISFDSFLSLIFRAFALYQLFQTFSA
jgi:hypothetical protein